MTAASSNDRLVVWGFATFHTAFFMAVLILLLYVGGNLGALLGSLNSVVGVALFGALWATTWFSTRQSWRGLHWSLAGPPDFRRLAWLGMLWGGLNGMLFATVLLCVFIAGSIAQSIQTGAMSQLGNALSQLLAISSIFVSCGMPVAFLSGAIFGLAFAGVDSLLIALSQQGHILAIRPRGARNDGAGAKQL
jgi:hypothetical protein